MAKIAIATVLAGAVGAGATVAVRTTSPHAVTAPATIPAAVVDTAPIASGRQHMARPIPDLSPGTTRDGIDNVIAPPAAPQTRAMFSARPRMAASARSAAKTSNRSSQALSEEIELVRAAQVAMRQGDVSAALTMLESHASRFPRGALSEEREAARAIALCELRQFEQGRRVARRLLAASPHTPLAGRIRGSCEPFDR
jgi:hypothetical protein